MAYNCNDKSCNPCKHAVTNVTCPSCLKHDIVVSPSGWFFCPDWAGCEWEMSYEQYIRHDINKERSATLKYKIEQLKEGISASREELKDLEAKLLQLR